MDFDQNPITSEPHSTTSNSTKPNKELGNQRFRPCTLSGYPSFWLVPSSLEERVQQSLTVISIWNQDSAQKSAHTLDSCSIQGILKCQPNLCNFCRVLLRGFWINPCILVGGYNVYDSPKSWDRLILIFTGPFRWFLMHHIKQFWQTAKISKDPNWLFQKSVNQNCVIFLERFWEVLDKSLHSGGRI